MRIVLFFTGGISLKTWDKIGMLDREVALYQKLHQYGVQTSFVTYGDSGDLEYACRIPDIKVCCNRWNLPNKMYEFFLPLLHTAVIRRADIVKTNQMRGADIALRCSRLWNKKFIARCGYMWSTDVRNKENHDPDILKRAQATEEKVFTSADHIILTTQEMKKSIVSRFPSQADRITVIPNFVDTDIFYPVDISKREKGTLCFVGRLSPEKNLENLLMAVNNTSYKLQIIGMGPLKDKLEKIAGENEHIHFTDRIPNNELPKLLNKCDAFVLPSLYEGHPKVLIEAMSCGLPVIATDVAGINSLITHGKTGWLSNTDVESLKDAICHVLSDTTLQDELGKNAAQFARENFSLQKVAQREQDLYQRVVGQQ